MARGKGQTGEDTREAILSAAEQVFAAAGFAGTAMSAIAKRAEVTKSLIHHHFGSKQDLWQRVKRDRFEAFARKQRHVLTAPTDAHTFMTDTFETYFRFLQANPLFLRLMWWSQAEADLNQSAGLDDPVRAVMHELIRGGIARVQTFQDQGTVRKDIEARFIFAAFVGLLRHWFVARMDHPLAEPGESDSDLDDGYLNAVVKLFIDAVVL